MLFQIFRTFLIDKVGVCVKTSCNKMYLFIKPFPIEKLSKKFFQLKASKKFRNFKTRIFSWFLINKMHVLHVSGSNLVKFIGVHFITSNFRFIACLYSFLFFVLSVSSPNFLKNLLFYPNLYFHDK